MCEFIVDSTVYLSSDTILVILQLFQLLQHQPIEWRTDELAFSRIAGLVRMGDYLLYVVCCLMDALPRSLLSLIETTGCGSCSEARPGDRQVSNVSGLVTRPGVIV